MDSSTLQTTGPPVWLLSLDGGGVCGLSSLLILENIMECIQKSEGLSEVPRPCDRFDLIGGTGTGGIIAIMLGRLKMSIDQSIKEYKSLAWEMFDRESTRSSTMPASAFSAAGLEAAIKRMIRNICTDPNCGQQKTGGHISGMDTCPPENMLLADENCTKTAVLAMSEPKFETRPTFFTTYHTPGLFTECEIWEVARATSAAKTLFDPIIFGCHGIEFIDTSYRYSNPCEALISEAERQFPSSPIMILSIGAGLSHVVEISDSRCPVLKALRRMATSSEQTDLRLKEKYKTPGVYHRFNVEFDLRDSKVLERQTFGDITAHTVNCLKGKTRSVEQFVATFTRSDVSQLKAHHDQNDEKCLSDLYITDPFTDKKDIEDRKGGLLKDSYRWILSHENFQQFLDEDESPILWIKGDPGKGKTMLLCGMINELERTYPTSLSYFFCQATNDQVNTASSVLRGLIYHLARQNPHLIKHVRKKYDYNQNLFESQGASQELCHILTSMLNDPSLKNAILVVDALDECSTGQKDLLEFIAKPSPAKWIVSSRNSPDVKDILDNAEQKIMIHLEINQDSVSEAVNSFIDFKVDELAQQKRYNREMELAVMEHLRLNANGTFLWVSMVCQELSNCRKQRTRNKLTSFPHGLEALYERMVQQMLDSDDADICKHIMAQVLVAYRPLTLEELCVLVESLENEEKQDVEDLIALCGSFLTIRNNVVSFVHQSAKDYLQEKALGKIVPFGIQHQHQTIFSRSLVVLHRKLRRDMYNLTAPGCLIEEVSRPQPDPLAAIGYPCFFWVDHLIDSSADGMVSKNGEILAFLREKYLQWLEAFSLSRGICIAGRAMEKLKLYSEKAPQNLRDLVNDAHRFFLLHAAFIEIAPLQVYFSALIFSPTNSLIRQMFSHEEPDWIEVKPKVEANWDACLQTLEGHHREVKSVIFSNDGQRLASGSGDNTIKIWDVTSGVCLQTLDSHELMITALIFSNNGERLASGSADTTVKIWDATSGACLRTLEGHRRAVASVVFSNDGQRLASGSFDSTVKIWDATSGVCLQTLEGHHREVESLVFSNDGQLLASGSYDNTIKIWDVTSGVCLRTLEGHTSLATSLVFSNNSQPLASAFDDKRAKIWDATSGACLQTLDGRRREVTSVPFSNDGHRLASGSDDSTVKIWDVTSGAFLRTLEGHHREVTSIVFSIDGQRLASGSDDRTVKIWDAVSGACLQTLEGHHREVTTVVFSLNGQCLASGSDDRTVKIWDATSGACLQTLEGHNGEVTSVVFSYDGQRLASGSDDRTVKIWDVTSGVCLQTFMGHHSYVTSVVLSNKGQLLASGSDDRTVKIWDATSGACLRTLEGHHREVTSVVFSIDEQRLASGSDDRTVKIWDATSGACLQTLEGHGQEVTSLVFLNDGQRLASGSNDRTAKIWDVTSGVCLRTLEGYNSCATSLVLSHDGQLIASGSDDITVMICDAPSGAYPQTPEGHHRQVTSVLFSNKGRLLASASDDGTVKIWDVISGVCLRTFIGHRSHVKSVVLSNNGQLLASGSDDRTVKIWDATSGACLQTLEGHTGEVTSVVFSIDGQRLASGSGDWTAKIWDAISGACLQTIEGHGLEVTSVVFLNDGQRLASGSKDRTVKIWDAISGACLQILQAHHGQVTSAMFSTSAHRPASPSFFDHTFSPPSQSDNYCISRDGLWVLREQKRVLWLPLSYRPVESVIARHALAFSTPSGRIILMRFRSTG